MRQAGDRFVHVSGAPTRVGCSAHSASWERVLGWPGLMLVITQLKHGATAVDVVELDTPASRNRKGPSQVALARGSVAPRLPPSPSPSSSSSAIPRKSAS